MVAGEHTALLSLRAVQRWITPPLLDRKGHVATEWPGTPAADTDQSEDGIVVFLLVPLGQVAALDDLPAPTLQQGAQLLEALVYEPDADLRDTLGIVSAGWDRRVTERR